MKYLVVDVVCVRVVSASKLVALLCISCPPDGAQHSLHTALLSPCTNVCLDSKIGIEG